jgi:hypothetical protein
MALEFNAIQHEYRLDGRLVPSATQILQAQGLVRLNGVPAFVLERARARGSAVHRLIHFENECDLDERSIDPQYAGYLIAWRRCVAERQLKALLCEHRVASARFLVAGTFDLLAESGGYGWLFDFCTGNLEKLAKHLQTGGYLGMAFESAKAGDERLREVLDRHRHWRRAAVRLRADGSFRVIEYDDPADYSKFTTLAAAWHIRRTEGAVLLPEDLAA